MHISAGLFTGGADYTIWEFFLGEGTARISIHKLFRFFKIQRIFSAPQPYRTCIDPALTTRTVIEVLPTKLVEISQR